MNQKAHQAIAVMMNAFPDGFEDKELRLRTMDNLLQSVDSEAVCEAAQRFCSGEVKGQSTRKAPTVPEFVQEAKRIQREVLPYRNRQSALPAPKAEEIFQVSPEERARVGLALEVFRKAGPNNTPRTLARKESVPTLISLAEQYGLHVPDNVRTQAKESA